MKVAHFTLSDNAPLYGVAQSLGIALDHLIDPSKPTIFTVNIGSYDFLPANSFLLSLPSDIQFLLVTDGQPDLLDVENLRVLCVKHTDSGTYTNRHASRIFKFCIPAIICCSTLVYFDCSLRPRAAAVLAELNNSNKSMTLFRHYSRTYAFSELAVYLLALKPFSLVLSAFYLLDSGSFFLPLVSGGLFVVDYSRSPDAIRSIFLRLYQAVCLYDVRDQVIFSSFVFKESDHILLSNTKLIGMVEPGAFRIIRPRFHKKTFARFLSLASFLVDSLLRHVSGLSK